MRNINVILTDQSGGEGPAPVQVPESAFETALLRTAIKSQMRADFKTMGPHGFSGFSLSDENDEFGWFEFSYTYEHEFDMNKGLADWWLRGRVRVIEREYPASEHFRIIVDWEVSAQSGEGWEVLAQSNYAPYPVVVRTWEKK